MFISILHIFRPQQNLPAPHLPGICRPVASMWRPGPESKTVGEFRGHDKPLSSHLHLPIASLFEDINCLLSLAVLRWATNHNTKSELRSLSFAQALAPHWTLQAPEWNEKQRYFSKKGKKHKYITGQKWWCLFFFHVFFIFLKPSICFARPVWSWPARAVRCSPHRCRRPGRWPARHWLRAGPRHLSWLQGIHAPPPRQRQPERLLGWY